MLSFFEVKNIDIVKVFQHKFLAHLNVAYHHLALLSLVYGRSAMTFWSLGFENNIILLIMLTSYLEKQIFLNKFHPVIGISVRKYFPVS